MSIEELLANGYWSEREGRAAVGLWRASGESLKGFCARTGLRRTRMKYWRRRLEEPEHAAHAEEEFALAPVTVLPRRHAGGIAIELLSGRTVRVEGDVDDMTLARVISVAERAGC